MNAAHVSSDARLASRLKLAELTASLGVGVLGAGVGLLLATWLSGLALPIIAAGLVLHAWGMRDKHALEAGAPQPAWATAVYWLCWLGVAALALYATLRAAIGS